MRYQNAGGTFSQPQPYVERDRPDRAELANRA